MTNIIVSSDHELATTTALLFGARGHKVAHLGSGSSSLGDQELLVFGEPHKVSLKSIDELETKAQTVGFVFDGGEDIRSGIDRLLAKARPDLLAVIDAGVSGALHATEASHRHDFELSRVLLIGGFPIGGSRRAVTIEASGLYAGFLASNTPASTLTLAKETLPQICITDSVTAVLSRLNPLLVVPSMILNAMRIERGDNVRLDDEGFGRCVQRLVHSLDEERLRLGEAMGLDLLTFEQLLDRHDGAAGIPGGSAMEKVSNFPLYLSAKVPSSLRDRQFEHELRSTIAPMAEMAMMLGVPVPTVDAVLRLGEVLVQTDVSSAAYRTAKEFLSRTGIQPPRAAWTRFAYES
jgi:hypothetical protein